MARHRVGYLAALGALCLSSVGFGGIGPSFELELCAWRADEIVVCSQEPGSGKLTVLENWKGEMVKGAEVTLEDLPRVPIKSEYRWATLPEMTGKRIVLFLMKAEAEAGAPARWKGVAHFGGSFVSAAWIEDGKIYTFQQVMNPGPTQLVDWGSAKNEADFKLKAMEIAAVRDAFQKARVLEPAARAAALVPLTLGASWYGRRESLEALGQCGKPAADALRQMLRDGKHEQRIVVSSLARAAGDDDGKEMMEIVREEMAFWKRVGPTLKDGWWSNLEPRELRDTYQQRLELTVAALGELKRAPFFPAGELLAEFRSFLLTPEFRERPDYKQMREICAEALEATPGGVIGPVR